MPRKIASRKKAKPSIENGIPMIGPAMAMKPGHSRPSSKERTVPLTAPTANRMAVPFDHRFANSRYSGSPVRSHSPSLIAISSGIAMPATANRMWKPSDIAICERAARRSVMPSSFPHPRGSRHPSISGPRVALRGEVLRRP